MGKELAFLFSFDVLNKSLSATNGFVRDTKAHIKHAWILCYSFSNIPFKISLAFGFQWSYESIVNFLNSPSVFFFFSVKRVLNTLNLGLI